MPDVRRAEPPPSLSVVALLFVVLLPDMPTHDRTRGKKHAKEVEGAQDRAVAVPPVDLIVRVWMDRDVEVLNPGALPPWMASAALFEAGSRLDYAGQEPAEEEDASGDP